MQADDYLRSAHATLVDLLKKEEARVEPDLETRDKLIDALNDIETALVFEYSIHLEH